MLAASSRRATSLSVRSPRLQALLEPLVAGAALVVHRRAAELVDRAVVDDPEHPRAHRAAGALVAGAGAPDRQEGLLHDVLGDVAAADHPVGEREGGAGVAVVDQLERARVVALDQLHEVLVGERAKVCRSGHVVEVLRPRSLRGSVQVVQQLPRLAPAVAQRAEGELGDVAGLGAPAVAAGAGCGARSRPTAAAEPTTAAAAGRPRRAQFLGSLSVASSHDSSSSAASSTSEPSVVSSRAFSSAGGSTGASAWRSMVSMSIVRSLMRPSVPQPSARAPPAA